MVLDKAGQPTPLTDPIEFTLYRIEEQYAWGYDEDEGRWTYDHRTRLVEEGRQEQPAGQTDYTQTFEISQNAPRFPDPCSVRCDPLGARTSWHREPLLVAAQPALCGPNPSAGPAGSTGGRGAEASAWANPSRSVLRRPTRPRLGLDRDR